MINPAVARIIAGGYTREKLQAELARRANLGFVGEGDDAELHSSVL